MLELIVSLLKVGLKIATFFTKNNNEKDRLEASLGQLDSAINIRRNNKLRDKYKRN